jgi:signal transduction histidine kinase
MNDLPRGREMERLMQLFLHDLRSPLGVAQGYVALLGGQALSAQERERALRSVSDAIARIAGMLDDVATLIAEEEPETLQGFVDAGLLCERVSADAGRRGMHVASRDACDMARVRVGTSVDRLSEAIIVVLSPSERARRASPGPLNLSITNNGRELGFRVARDGEPHPGAPDLLPFELEAVGSVEYLKAYRHISMLQGRVWREVGESRACGVTLPLSP